MKRFLIILISLLLFACSFCACSNNKQYDFPFVDIRWTRDGDSDTEYLRFYSNGEFSYYCGCGNPVNDSDLCDGYTFDPKTNVITLKYTFPSRDAVTKIKVIKCSEDELVLDFNGDIRTFYVEKDDEFSGEITHNGKKYLFVNFPIGIFTYSVVGCDEYSDDEIFEITHEKWDIIYFNCELFAIEDHLSSVETYLADISNYKWSVTVESSEAEEIIESQIDVTHDELTFFEQVSQITFTEYVLFDDIEIFGTLTKTSNDGLVTASVDLLCYNGRWYWRSGIIIDRVEGWPEYIVPLPASLNDKIDLIFNLEEEK